VTAHPTSAQVSVIEITSEIERLNIPPAGETDVFQITKLT